MSNADENSIASAALSSLDTQQLELVGRHRLIESLARGGLETALPTRDAGVDLIAYAGADKKAEHRRIASGTNASETHAAWPLQLKAATRSSFSVDHKYGRLPLVVMIYAWRVTEPQHTAFYAVPWAESILIAGAMGYLDTNAWRNDGRYSTSSPSERLRTLLDRYRVHDDAWGAALHDCVPLSAHQDLASLAQHLPDDDRSASAAAGVRRLLDRQLALAAHLKVEPLIGWCAARDALADVVCADSMSDKAWASHLRTDGIAGHLGLFLNGIRALCRSGASAST